MKIKERTPVFIDAQILLIQQKGGQSVSLFATEHNKQTPQNLIDFK